MTIDEYLAQYIEGYLFMDLRSMAAVRIPEGQRAGAVGYPMVMTALSGIEVLGTLTSQATFNTDHGAPRFAEFWANYVYVERPAFARLSDSVYELVRHGLAHAFMTKPMIVVTKHHDGRHLKRSADSIVYVDALTLAEDLEAAYWKRLKPRMAGKLRATMETRFHELRTEHWNEYENKQNKIAKFPVEAGGQPLSARPACNSPTVLSHYSVNISTTGFDKPE